MPKKPTYEELEKRVQELEQAESEYKRNEEQLIHSHDLMNYIVSHARSAIAVHDRDLNYVYVSKRYLKDYKIDEQDIIGKHHYEVFPDLPQKWRDVHQRSLTGEVLSAEEDPYYREDGSVDWTRWECRPWYESDGSIGGIIVYTEVINERKKAEETLRRNEALLNTTQKLSKVGGWEWDLEQHTMFWTDEVYRIHDLQPNDITPGSAAHIEQSIECYDPEDRPAILKAFKNCVENGQAYDLEIPFTTMKGRRIWVRTVAEPVLDGDRIVRIVGNLMDITERKKAEEDLRESESKFRSVAEQSPNMLFINKKGRVVYVNDRCFEIMGYNKNEFYSHDFNFYSLLARESIKQAEYSLKTHAENMEVPPLEYTLIKKNGSKIETMINTKLIDYKGERAILGIVTDITQQKLTEKELKKVQERYLLATSGGKVGIWDWNLTTGDMFVSPNLKAMLGYDDHEIKNHIRDWGKNIYAEDIETVMKEANDCIDGTKNEYHVEHRMVHKDGSLRWFLASGSVEKDKDGQAIRFLGTDTEITSLKNLEEKFRQTQKMEALGTLSGGIAHEFNNILGIIIGNTELAIDDVPEWNPAKDCLHEIRTASLRAKDVVRQIMSFSRKTPATRKPMQISTIIQEALKLMRATIPTSIEVKPEILCKDEMILANPTEISQIIMNLCSNSVHAMEEENGVLKVRLETAALDGRCAAQYSGLTPGEYVKLTVKDNGSGIDPKLINSVFDPYFTTKDVDKGLGMGLAVVYGIVKKHDGAISVHSKAGKGTKVEVLFPVTKETAQIEKEISKTLPRGTERILFVDDEVSIVKIVTQMLDRQGYQVVGKASSTEALKLFHEEPDKYDLVITDMAMPDMTGDLLAQALIEIRPTIPVIICTGYSDRMDEGKAMKSGIAVYAMKPLVKTDFLKTVRKVLDRAKSAS